MALPNRCVNCSISFNNHRQLSKQVLSLDSPLQELLTSWTLVEITTDHRVCQQCIKILQAQAQIDEPTRGFGHQAVCLGCGVSVLRARSIHIDRNRPEFYIIASWVPLIQVDLPIFTRVCRPCWRRATRPSEVSLPNIKQEPDNDLTNAVIDMEFVEMPSPNVGITFDENSSTDEPTQSRPPTPTPLPTPKPEQAEILSQRPTQSRPPTPPPLPTPKPEQAEILSQRQTITLPNYKRVAATSRRCIFSNCLNIEKVFLLIPTVVRLRILMDFKIYIPRCARICSNHLYKHNNWNHLVNEPLFNTFTAQQIEDVIYLSEKQQQSHFNFEDIENVNEHMRHYWIGITVQQFYDIINGAPSLVNQVKKYKTALAMYLAKLRTGDSDARLSTIFGVAKITFQRQIAKVKDCLLREYDMII